jgi:hypothetical protein
MVTILDFIPYGLPRVLTLSPPDMVERRITTSLLSKKFANLFVLAKNEKFVPKNKNKLKIHCKLSCRQKRVESVTILPSWASKKF